MKLAKYSKLSEKMDKEKDEADARIDRKKYALTVYGRAIFFITKYLESLRTNKPINTSKSLRIIQDFVDVSYDQRTHFLGLTTTKHDTEYLVVPPRQRVLDVDRVRQRAGADQAADARSGLHRALLRRGHGHPAPTRC